MSKTTLEKIEAAKEEIKQKEAQIKRLLQQQKAQERKDRNHRLCQRGGQVEKLLPGLVKLTDEQFSTFVQKTLLSGFAERVLHGLLPPENARTEPCAAASQGAGDAVAEPAVAAAQGNAATMTNPANTTAGAAAVPMAKPALTAAQASTAQAAKPAETARQTA